MPFTDMENIINPGERLRKILEELFPSDFSSGQSCINKIDSALFAEGELASLVYRSTINYLLRRLISTAVYIDKKREKEGLPKFGVQNDLRNFINKNLAIRNNSTIEKIVALLIECLKVKEEIVSPSVVKAVKLRNETLCYICGRQLDFATVGEMESAELEHVFPRNLGGSSKAEDNLRYACSKCNKWKKSYADDSDYHYEEICLMTDEEFDEKSFRASFEHTYKLAIRSKNQYSCYICNEPAVKRGELHFARRNPEDSWHFLNIDTYCAKHLVMVKKQQNRKAF